METNTRLEALSNNVRRGEPVGFREALEVIDYQERLMVERKKQRRNKMKERVRLWIIFLLIGAWTGAGVVIVMGVVDHLEYKRAQADEVAQIMDPASDCGL